MIVAVSVVGVLVPRLVPVVPDARSNCGVGAAGGRARRSSSRSRSALRTPSCSRAGSPTSRSWSGSCCCRRRSTVRSRSASWTSAGGSATSSNWSASPLVGGVGGVRPAPRQPVAPARRATCAPPRSSQAEEAFLGARVRALMVRLAEKDVSTEEHTRRVAALAVEVGRAARAVGDAAALAGDRRPAARRRQALGAERDPAEAGPARRRRVRRVKQHPERGRELLTELGGFDDDGQAARPRPPRAARRHAVTRAACVRTISISRRASSRSAMCTTPEFRPRQCGILANSATTMDSCRLRHHWHAGSVPHDAAAVQYLARTA